MIVQQYRYYGDSHPLTSNGSFDSWVSGTALSDLTDVQYDFFIVNAPIGTRFYINDKSITMGVTDTYMAKAPIASFRIDEDSLKLIIENNWNVVLTLEKK